MLKFIYEKEIRKKLKLSYKKNVLFTSLSANLFQPTLNFATLHNLVTNQNFEYLSAVEMFQQITKTNCG